MADDELRAAMRLLKAIYEKTGGRNRGVRDVTELETGQTAEEARDAWRGLLSKGLIERFSVDYAARLSVKGLEFIRSGRMQELLTAPPSPPPVEAETPRQALPRKVAIVHGHGTGAREAVAGFLEERAFQAIPLHDRAGQGRSIMEQVEAHGDIGFAVVLMTPDDLGRTAGGTEELRPRLDVMMELGYLIGRLGRAKVCAFVVNSATNLSTELAGVAVESFDSRENWKSVLSGKLQAAGGQAGGIPLQRPT